MELSVYNPRYAELRSLEYLPWDYVAEPYQSSKIELRSFAGFSADELSDATISWSVDGTNYTTTGEHSFLHTFGTVGWTVLLATLSPPSGSSTVTIASVAVMVKYVRREVTSLTVEDRTRMFAAMKAVYTTPTEEGQKLYGSSFKGLEYFVSMHLRGAGAVSHLFLPISQLMACKITAPTVLVLSPHPFYRSSVTIGMTALGS